MVKIINDSIRGQWADRGYVLLKDSFNQHYLDLLEDAHLRMTRRAKTILSETHGSERALASFYRSSGPEVIVVPERTSPQDICRLEFLAGSDEFIRDLLASLVTPVMNNLLGEEAVLFKDKCNEKLPGGGAFPPHQDMAAYEVFEARYYATAMVPLDRATQENGCLQFAPDYKLIAGLQTDLVERDIGGYPLFTRYRGGRDNGDIHHSVAKQLKWELLPIERGDLVIFDAFVPHRSEANRSDQSRRALFFTYNKKKEGDHYNVYYDRKRQFYDDPIFHISTPTTHASV